MEQEEEEEKPKEKQKGRGRKRKASSANQYNDVSYIQFIYTYVMSICINVYFVLCWLNHKEYIGSLFLDLFSTFSHGVVSFFMVLDIQFPDLSLVYVFELTFIISTSISSVSFNWIMMFLILYRIKLRKQLRPC